MDTGAVALAMARSLSSTLSISTAAEARSLPLTSHYVKHRPDVELRSNKRDILASELSNIHQHLASTCCRPRQSHSGQSWSNSPGGSASGHQRVAHACPRIDPENWERLSARIGGYQNILGDLILAQPTCCARCDSTSIVRAGASGTGTRASPDAGDRVQLMPISARARKYQSSWARKSDVDGRG